MLKWRCLVTFKHFKSFKKLRIQYILKNNYNKTEINAKSSLKFQCVSHVDSNNVLINLYLENTFNRKNTIMHFDILYFAHYCLWMFFFF